MAGERDDGPSTIRLFVEAPLAAGGTVALASGQAHYLRQRDAPQAGGPGPPVQRPRRGVGGRHRDSRPQPRRRPPGHEARRAAPGARPAAPVRAAQGRAHPLRGREGDRARRRRHPPRPHPLRPDQAGQRRATPRPRHRGGGAVRPPGGADRRAPPALSPMRSPAGRRSAACWSATPRPNARSPSRWPTPRQASWWGRKAASRRPSGACSPGIRRPSPPAWAPASCARRPPWRRLWPAGRRLPATGAEAARRPTRPCHVRSGGSTGWTAAPE